MKVQHKESRWGEVTIKKQGKQKNDFEKTKSFSITNEGKLYSIDEYKNILEIVTNLSYSKSYSQLVKCLEGLDV